MANTNGAILLPELLDDVFRLLLNVDGGITLGNCMQVCQAWLELCYPLRFRRFKFKELARETYTSITDVESTKTFDRFLQFLRASPRLCSCISEPRLENKVITNGVFFCRIPTTPPPKMLGLDIDVLWQIIGLLPQLRMLDLIVLALDFPSTALPTYSPFDINLERLTICNRYNSGCTVPSLEHLQSFLRAFTSVRHLILGRVQAETSPSSLGGRSEKLLVKKLTLLADHSSTLAACVDPARLTVVNMRRCMFYQQLDFPYDILGRNVRDLRLAVLGYDSDEKGIIDMRLCPNITSLLIPFMFYLNTQHMRLPEFGYSGWNIACSLLSGAPATLREVLLVFNLYSFSHTNKLQNADLQDLFVTQLNRINWARLVPAVGKLEQLEHIRIQIRLLGAGACQSPRDDQEQFVTTITSHALRYLSGNQRVRNLLQFELAPPAEPEIWDQ